MQNEAEANKPGKRLRKLRNPAGAKILGNRLRALRKNIKWSRQRLATEAGIEVSTVKRIEFALTSPTFDVLISLSRALDVPMHELVQDDVIVASDAD